MVALDKNIYPHILDIPDNDPNEITPSSSLAKRIKVGGAIGVAVIAGSFLVSKNENSGTSLPKPNEPHKVYIAKLGDTAWSISNHAFPNSDPRDHTDMIVEETGAVINPGEKIILPDSSEIGTEVPGNPN